MSTGNRALNPVIWDETVCHQYWYVFGPGNVAQPGWCRPTGGSFIPVPIRC
ncbi:MAG: hypothetical protein U0Q47_09705 [Mycobacterium sp.]